MSHNSISEFFLNLYEVEYLLYVLFYNTICSTSNRTEMHKFFNYMKNSVSIIPRRGSGFVE